MAIDEAVLESCPSTGPTLRFYGWEGPALSLGYRQPAEHWTGRARAHGLDLVRRPTGGGAVLHGCDLTYSIALPRGCPGVPDSMRRSYAWIRDILLRGLREVGLSVLPAEAPGPAARHAASAQVCFGVSNGHEIELLGRKLVGSAQRRTRFGFLQQGSIPLTQDADLCRDVLGLVPPLAPIGTLAAGDLRRALTRAFEVALGAEMSRGELELAELRDARRRVEARRENALWIPRVSLRTAPTSADMVS